MSAEPVKDDRAAFRLCAKVEGDVVPMTPIITTMPTSIKANADLLQVEVEFGSEHHEQGEQYQRDRRNSEGPPSSAKRHSEIEERLVACYGAPCCDDRG